MIRTIGCPGYECNLCPLLCMRKWFFSRFIRGQWLMHRQDDARAAHGRLRKREALSIFGEDLPDHIVAAAAKLSMIGILKSPGRRARLQATYTRCAYRSRVQSSHQQPLDYISNRGCAETSPLYRRGATQISRSPMPLNALGLVAQRTRLQHDANYTLTSGLSPRLHVISSSPCRI
jgi:hypothetical protein